MEKAIIILIIILIGSGFVWSQESAIDRSLVVGSLPSEFSVSQMGAATYKVPIDLPDGRAGLTPGLSLNYYSQGGNGLLGVRWSVGGISMIGRTGTNLYNEDFIDGVDFENDDKFDFDGQRLIPVDGTFTEYRTENESFSRIIIHGLDVNNPDWFEVFAKDGRVYEYGNVINSNNSKLVPANKTETLIWQINRMKDRQGNYVDYYYADGNEVGKIIRIKYTGNLKNNAEPFYDVDFEYDIRADISKMYVSGGYIEQKSLLKAIAIKYNSAIVQTYNINYNFNNLFPRIESITTSDNDGTFINPTSFVYGAENNASEIVSTNIDDNNQNVDYTIGDFNGDGNTDILCSYYEIVNGIWNHETWCVFYSTGDGSTFTQSVSKPHDTNFLYFIPGDFNGDGTEDLVKVYYGRFELLLKEGDEFKIKASQEYNGSVIQYRTGNFLDNVGKMITGGSISKNSVAARNSIKNIDINGNGIDEILLVNYDLGNGYGIIKSFEWNGTDEYNDVFFHNNGVGNFEPGYVFQYDDNPNLNPVAAGDYTGDGKTNLILNPEVSKSIILELDVTTNESFPILVEINANGYNFPTENTFVKYVGDFNGDGISDLFTPINGVWTVKYFDGKYGWITGSSVPIPNSPIFTEYEDFQFGLSDFNGDGKTDVLQVYQEYYFDPRTMTEPKFVKSHWDVNYSNGTEFVKEPLELPFNSPKKCYIDGVQFLDVNGDGKSECIMESLAGGYSQIMFFNRDEQCYNVQKITNGLGHVTNLTYEPITNTDSYVKGYNANYPLIDLQYPLLVVVKSEQDNGIGGYFEKTYKYETLRAHKLGKGNLGFQKLICTDKQANMQTITEFGLINNNDLYYYVFPETIIQHPLNENGEVITDNKISETKNNVSLKNTLGGNNYVFSPIVIKSTEKYWDNESDNTFVKMITTTQPIEKIDMWGNSINSSIIVSKDETGIMYSSTIFESTYDNDIANWILGRIDNTLTINVLASDQEQTQVNTEYLYYQPNEQSWPLVKSKKITPNNAPLYANESFFEYNIYGNVTKITNKANDLSDIITPQIISRETIYEYKDADNYNGRFLTAEINTDGVTIFKNMYGYNLTDGTLSYSTNASGLTTEYTYGNFSQLVVTKYPDNTQKVFYTHWKDIVYFAPLAPLNAVYVEFTNNPDGSIDISFKDKLGRELRMLGSALHDGLICSDKIYNSRGFLHKVSEPYFFPNIPDEADENQWTTQIYNSLNNKIGKVVSPTNTIDFTYSGGQTKATNTGTEISKTVTIDALGRKLSVIDPAGSIEYTYYSDGNTKSINALGSVTEMYYDLAGRQRLTVEPNIGSTQYWFSNFGELLKQTDNKGNTYSMVYDQFGRLSTKTLENTGEVTRYNYNNMPSESGFGLLQSISGTNDIIYQYSYDHLNRISAQIEKNEGISYTSFYTYNSIGKLESYTYPSGYSVKYQYTDNGSLHKVLDGTIEDKILWQADEVNRRGQLTNYSLGNGLSTEIGYDDLSGLLESIVTGQVQNLQYKFDQITGNLEWRKDHKYYLTETFTYDALLKSRLETWQVNSGQIYSINYQPNGNIHTKSGVNLDGYPLSVYQYGQNAGLNAVTKILNPTVEYSQNATPQTIEYTAFNKINSIIQTNIEGGIERRYQMDFTYGPDNARKKTILYKDKGIEKIKYFVGGNYEKEVDREGNYRELHYLSAVDGIFAIYEKKSDGKNSMFYIHKDHLGSFQAVTNNLGYVLQENSFDPWGRERNPINWTYTKSPYVQLFDRGYTGHEHMTAFDLINMNGRVYDPWLGRMLSPDPVLQDPSNSQNYNRYSYANNNPLKYTDPSGYSYLETMKDQYNFEGGGFNYRGTYYSYNSTTGNFESASGNVIGGPAEYTYNWTNGNYYDSKGNVTTYSQVHYQYVLQNSRPATDHEMDLYNKAYKAQHHEISLLPDISFMFYSGFSAPTGKLEQSYKLLASTGGKRDGWIFGQSIDVTFATPTGGYSYEAGSLSNGIAENEFVSKGIAYGAEASLGWNLIFIKTKNNFKYSDLEGLGATFTLNIGFISISRLGNTSPGYPTDIFGASYKGWKVGIGPGIGGSAAPRSTTTFLDWIPESFNNIDWSNLHWH